MAVTKRKKATGPLSLAAFSTHRCERYRRGNDPSTSKKIERALHPTQQTAPHSLEPCQAAVFPQRRRKRSRARLADAVVLKTAAAKVTDEGIIGGGGARISTRDTCAVEHDNEK